MNNEHGIGPADFKLVKKIAGWVYKMYCPKQMQSRIFIDDLYHTGIIGLLEAEKSMDPSKNPNAYKAIRIKGTMIDFLRKQTLVQAPRKLWRQAREVRAAAMELKKAGRSATHEAIAKHLAWPLATVQKAAAVKLSIVATEEDTRGDENETPGVILTGTEPNPEQALGRAELADAIRRCLEGIKNSIDRVILICRIRHDMELNVLARVMKFSIEGIRQKQIRAQNQMKKCLEDLGWSNNIPA